MTIMTTVVLTAPFILFFAFLYFSSQYYHKQTKNLVTKIFQDTEEVIEKIKTRGQEEQGWRNNFPSITGWENSTIFVAKEFILIAPRSKFPFLFKTHLQPFLLAKDIGELRNRLNFNRIFKPLKVTRQNFDKDLEVIFKPDGLFGQIKMYLTFENMKANELIKIERLKSWC